MTGGYSDLRDKGMGVSDDGVGRVTMTVVVY